MGQRLIDLAAGNVVVAARCATRIDDVHVNQVLTKHMTLVVIDIVTVLQAANFNHTIVCHFKTALTSC